MREYRFNSHNQSYSQPTVMMIKAEKKWNVRAHTQPLVFDRLAIASPSKKHDKQITFIVCVGGSFNFFI
jgi:hypothetical protein